MYKTIIKKTTPVVGSGAYRRTDLAFGCSKFEIALEQHLPNVESLKHSNAADSRFEIDKPIFPGDFSGQRKQVDDNQAVFPLEDFDAGWFHILFPRTL